jgi:Amt family ammonium transporter
VPKIDAGDTAWVLTATALVMLMTPALALFYGGLVRRKNVLSILMQCMFVLSLVSVTWVLIGYTLAFGKDVNGLGIIGNLDNLGLKGVGSDPGPYAKTIPASLFALFQMMFAIITPALIAHFAEMARSVHAEMATLFRRFWPTSSEAAPAADAKRQLIP